MMHGTIIQTSGEPTNASTPFAGIGGEVLSRVEFDQRYPGDTAKRVMGALFRAAWRWEVDAEATNSSPENRERGKRITAAFAAVNHVDAEEFFVPRVVIEEIVDGGPKSAPVGIGPTSISFLSDILAATAAVPVQN